MASIKALASKKMLFRFFLFQKLPLAFVAGIRVKEFTDTKVVTWARYKWLTQNPFRSMYFACQAMAAEMATGLLVMEQLSKQATPVSMLIIRNEANYFKKITGKAYFSCEIGEELHQLVQTILLSGEAGTIDLKVIATNENAETVAEFSFTWSLKAKLK